MKRLSSIAAAFMLCATTLSADVYFDGSTGTAAPGATLGGYSMTAFPDDTRAFGSVSTIPGPSGADLGVSPNLNHVAIGSGWATWSHGYTGDVYYTNGTTITITLPSNTRAFYFYAEPNAFSTFSMEATTDNGTSSGDIAVNGFAGAKYFGFYTDGTEAISQITVTMNTGSSFAIGEFGIYICPPIELSVSLNNTLLTVPNHRMIDITATVTVDGGCGAADPVLVSVTSDEPDNGVDDGNTVNDIDGVSANTEDYEFRVRAERCGSCDGRVYTVTYAVTEDNGNVVYQTAEIYVPVGQGGLD